MNKQLRVLRKNSLVGSAKLWSLFHFFPLFQITRLLVDRVQSLVELSGFLLLHHLQQFRLVVRQPGTRQWNQRGTSDWKYLPWRVHFNLIGGHHIGTHWTFPHLETQVNTIVSNKKTPLEWPKTAQAEDPLWGWVPCRYPGCKCNLSDNRILQHYVAGSVLGERYY